MVLIALKLSHLLYWENYFDRAPTTRPTTTTTEESIVTTPGTNCTSGEYYSDPASCSNYYRCVRGELKREQCAPGLHWDAKRHLCDWPSAAKCQTETGKAAYQTLISRILYSFLSPSFCVFLIFSLFPLSEKCFVIKRPFEITWGDNDARKRSFIILTRKLWSR